jgi:hypothetical protein
MQQQITSHESNELNESEELLWQAMPKKAIQVSFVTIAFFFIMLTVLWFLTHHRPERFIFYILSITTFPLFFANMMQCRRWIRTDATGICWQTPLRKKQFHRWDEVVDFYLEDATSPYVTPVVSPRVVIVFRDEQKVHASATTENFFVLRQLQEVVVKNATTANTNIWEYKSIRQKDDWKYNYSISKIRERQLILNTVLMTIIYLFAFFSICSLFNFYKINFSSFISVLVMPFLVAFMMRLKEYQDSKKYSKVKIISTTTISVDRSGMSWQNVNGSGSASWEEVIGLRLDNVSGLYILSLAGHDEQELVFPKNACFRDADNPKAKWLPFEVIVKQYAPNVREQNIPIVGEALESPRPYSAYPVTGTKVYTYNIQKNITSKNDIYGLTAVGFFFSFITFVIAHYSIQVDGTLSLFIAFIVLMVFMLIAGGQSRVNENYRRSQVEVDDLGISLIGPKGEKWRVPWLSVVEFTILDPWTSQSVLTTRDGKKYRFAPRTAAAGELHEEINRRILENLGRHRGHSA